MGEKLSPIVSYALELRARLSFCNITNKERSLSSFCLVQWKKVQVGKDQEKAQSEKDSHSKNRGGKNIVNNKVLIP